MQKIRIAALGHEVGGQCRVKVIFKEGGRMNREGEKSAYWMDQETYRTFNLGEEVTLEQFQGVGEVLEAANTDIYSKQ